MEDHLTLLNDVRLRLAIIEGRLEAIDSAHRYATARIRRETYSACWILGCGVAGVTLFIFSVGEWFVACCVLLAGLLPLWGVESRVRREEGLLPERPGDTPSRRS